MHQLVVTSRCEYKIWNPSKFFHLQYLCNLMQFIIPISYVFICRKNCFGVEILVLVFPLLIVNCRLCIWNKT